MYDRISEGDVVGLVRRVRGEFPGWRGRVPLRVARPPADRIYGQVPSAGPLLGRTAAGHHAVPDLLPPEWVGRVCPICRLLFRPLDHWERQRNGPHVHRRCVTPSGELERWVPAATINRWLHTADATYAGPTITPGVDIEFCVGDLPARITAGIAASNRGVLYRPDRLPVR